MLEAAEQSLNHQQLPPFRLLAISQMTAPEASQAWRTQLAPWLTPLIHSGVTAVQIREKALDDRDLLALVSEARALIDREGAEGAVHLLVNGRADIAAAAGADGVHLPDHGNPIEPLRRTFPDLLFGRSTHNLQGVLSAQREGADYVTFGPVFETPSKEGILTPTGLTVLAGVAEVGVPVLALGGIVSSTQFRPLADHGAVGVAGIRLFDDKKSLASTVSAAMEVFG